MNNNIAFRARVKMRDIKEVSAAIAPAAPIASIGSSAVGSSTAGIAGTLATNTVGSAANVIGSAFSSKASGINSSGIVPSVMESAAPHVTPATIVSSNAHPSLIGSAFSMVGSFFHRLGRVKITIKDPSR